MPSPVYSYLRRCLLLGVYVLGALGIVASGGGGGGGSDWRAGIFLPAETFYARCADPRSGDDPFGFPYPDTQGSILDENNFLRSFSDDTYLWYDEILDQDPGDFRSPLDYFEVLKTFALTPSGRPKDRFHFTIPSDEWFQLSQSGVAPGYGVTFLILSELPPREVVVAYTEPGAAATQPPANLARGARILSVDGVDIDDDTVSGINTLNAGLFPESVGKTTIFEVRDEGAAFSRTISITSDDEPITPVRHSIVTTPSGPVGYMLFNDHISTAESALVNAVNQLETAGVNDLVLDLRYNGGGFLDIASELAYMIAGPGPTAGRPFEVLEFNEKHPTTNPVTGQPLVPIPFHSTTQGYSVTPGQGLPSLDLPRVFVLTGAGTCSASESIINSLRGIGVEVILIGSTTCGKPYGFYAIENCGTTYFTIQFRGVNAAGFGDYSDGYSPQNTASNPGETLPGCSVFDDFSEALGDPNEARFAAALAYRDVSGTCPVASGRPASGETFSDGGILMKNPWLTNRILR